MSWSESAQFSDWANPQQGEPLKTNLHASMNLHLVRYTPLVDYRRIKSPETIEQIPESKRILFGLYHLFAQAGYSFAVGWDSESNRRMFHVLQNDAVKKLRLPDVYKAQDGLVDAEMQ